MAFYLDSIIFLSLDPISWSSPVSNQSYIAAGGPMAVRSLDLNRCLTSTKTESNQRLKKLGAFQCDYASVGPKACGVDAASCILFQVNQQCMEAFLEKRGSNLQSDT